MVHSTVKHVDHHDRKVVEALKKITPRQFQAKKGVIYAVKVTEEGLISGRYANLGVTYNDERDVWQITTWVMRERIIRGVVARVAEVEDIHDLEIGMYIAESEKTHLHDRINAYPIPAATFEKKYEPTEEKDLYRPTGIARIILNPFGCDIVIDAPWGGEQTGDRECYLCSPVDKADPSKLDIDGWYLLSKNDRTAYDHIYKVYGSDWEEVAFKA